MEHSLLHALLLTGLMVVLGGVLAQWWLIRPAARTAGLSWAEASPATAERLVFFGALAGTLATGIDLFVETAEIENSTIFGGVDLHVVWRFATGTTVGHLDVTRGVFFLLAAVAIRLPLARGWKWLTTGLMGFGALLAMALVSHAAAQPDSRALFISCQVVHLTCVAAWMGVLLHLFAARRYLLTSESAPLLAEIVRRFSPFALATTSLLALTGVFAAWRFLQTTGALFTSAYGLTLLVKLALLAPAVAAGWINFRHIRPALLASVSGASSERAAKPAPAAGLQTLLVRFGRTLELEVTAGVLVVAVAGILGSLSPPGEDGSLLLTAAQTHALLTPHWPRSHVDNWTLPDDPRGPTIDDLHYSEFTHNWSGVVVMAMGLGWLMQARGGRSGGIAGKITPFVFVPFGLFIAVAANPEVYLLRTITPMQALSDPQIIEHQMSALLVFLLAWLGWRDLKNPPALRPLGYPLPIVMIVGSLLLLGHAHSTPNVPDEVTNIINTQHAVFGTFGIFAGTVRWFTLRGLMPARWANILWPGCVIGLGLFMAFVYREAV
ncbi:MAG TPA: CopD family protein [Chthoniobacter sp.]|jgi:putative copper export protein